MQDESGIDRDWKQWLRDVHDDDAYAHFSHAMAADGRLPKAKAFRVLADQIFELVLAYPRGELCDIKKYEAQREQLLDALEDDVIGRNPAAMRGWRTQPEVLFERVLHHAEAAAEAVKHHPLDHSLRQKPAGPMRDTRGRWKAYPKPLPGDTSEAVGILGAAAQEGWVDKICRADMEPKLAEYLVSRIGLYDNSQFLSPMTFGRGDFPVARNIIDKLVAEELQRRKYPIGSLGQEHVRNLPARDMDEIRKKLYSPAYILYYDASVTNLLSIYGANELARIAKDAYADAAHDSRMKMTPDAMTDALWERIDTEFRYVKETLTDIVAHETCERKCISHLENVFYAMEQAAVDSLADYYRKAQDNYIGGNNAGRGR